MTFVVCPNLAVDRVLTAEALCPGGTTRCRALNQQAGGKGANVARALRALRSPDEAHDTLTGFVAGQTGRLFTHLAGREGLGVALVACQGDMRISTVILTDDGAVTRLFERGPEITGKDEAALLGAVGRRAAAANEWAIVDGAVPPGMSDGFYAAICKRLRRAGYRVLVDATGVQLAQSLAARPDFVKVNIEEACSAVGTPRDLCENEECLSGAELQSEGLELCRRLIAAGASHAVVTLGAAGAVGVVEGGAWLIRTPSVKTKNSVGSGDCFAAALLIALEERVPVEAALAAAAGVAAANAASPLTGHFDLDLARALASQAFVGPPAS